MRRTTPTFLGYLSALAVAIVLTDLGLVADQRAGWTDGNLIEATLEVLLALMFGGAYVAILAVPTALVGLPVVHLLARRLRSQEAQVLVAGLAGGLGALPWTFALDQVDGLERAWILVPLVALACAAGRASVIPWVPWVPVDDD